MVKPRGQRARQRRLVLQPRTASVLRTGADQVIDAIRPTLGPRPRIVAVDRTLDARRPELLDNGGLIAKRIIELPNRHADVGAMYVRDMLWRLQDQEGDGTATAAVLFQALFTGGIRLIAAGHNARRLQHFLEQGIYVILAELRRQTEPVSGPRRLASVAATVCHDPELSELLGEIFDIVGAHGRLEIRKGSGRGLEREYVEGIYWERGLLSRELIADYTRVRTDLENAAVVVSDLALRDPQQLVPVLQVAWESGFRHLLIVVDDIADRALSLLLANHQPDRFRIAAVKTPGYGKEQQAAALEDLALLTGGRAFLQATGDSFIAIRREHFGQARRAWATPQNFGVIGGKGDPRGLRRHIATLRAAHAGDAALDSVLRGKLQERLGRLLGGSATLRIGGVTEAEIEERQALAERTAAAVRGALAEGVVPGGGGALLACQPALAQRAQAAVDPDEAAAYRLLAQAVAAPLRTIAANAGYDPSDALAEVRLAGPGHGFDVISGRAVDMAAAGIVDPASVQKAAAYAGLSSAALALTIDVIVHRADQTRRASVRAPSARKRL